MNQFFIYIGILALLSGCTSSKKNTPPSTPPSAAVSTDKARETLAISELKKTPHWSYDGLFGPDLWGNLDPSFKTCKEGAEQSPIDLIWKKPLTSDGNLQFKFTEEDLVAKDTGHSAQVVFSGKQMTNIRGQIYSLLQIHFHSPSEHTISGKHYPIEAHFVHKDPTGQLAVLGVMFKEGAENPALSHVLAHIPSDKSKTNKTLVKINPSQFLPTILTYYNYKGSLTTPPCSEGVNWNIFNTPITASKEQIMKLQSFYNNNNRPIQPLNGRKVVNY
jgi:carbonic anhydrase